MSNLTQKSAVKGRHSDPDTCQDHWRMVLGPMMPGTVEQVMTGLQAVNRKEQVELKERTKRGVVEKLIK